MSNDTSRPARARSPEEKGQRRDDILRAAERLWAKTPHAELSMNQVAREAKLAKGTLYLYFDTKEEMFLSLLTEHLQAWLNRLTTLFDERRPTTPGEVADVLIASAQGYEELRRLLILLGTVLAHNEGLDLTMRFAREVRQMLQPVVERVPLPPEVTLRVLVHAYALSMGWQHATEETFATDFVRRQRDIAFLAPRFEPEFGLALRAVVERLAAEG
ncbi:TetR family transcriptional regulator [Deinococcus aetherius]|uniref:TetR family transcriptional regulator n=1 Tax=Deinococcus aetherius TaxID=200252 RepID=A0ABN6RFN3_9DEIO|nr:TetR/AcrR family transcriptional regulator [Deinococcus aetherius]BDP42166.1 TetR family transcriptional regulator [Deinococcus aetherius]